jgi:hypothetical protein
MTEIYDTNVTFAMGSLLVRRLAGPARRNPGRLTGHFRVDGRPRRVGQARRSIPFVQGEQRFE